MAKSIIAKVAIGVSEMLARRDHEVVGPCGHKIMAGELYVVLERTMMKWCYRCYKEIESQEDMVFKS